MFGDSVSGLLLGLLAVIVLVSINGFFVAAEFAIVKVRMTQIETMLRRGRPMARLAKRIISRLDSYLSATQLGITLASLGLGWLGKPAVEVFVRPAFEWMGLSQETVGTLSFAISFSFITFLHIVLEELVGEIQDEFDQEVPPVVKVPGAAEEYLAEGTVPLYQLSQSCLLHP